MLRPRGASFAIAPQDPFPVGHFFMEKEKPRERREPKDRGNLVG